MSRVPVAPGLRYLLPLPIGQVARFRRDPLGLLQGGQRRFGDVFRLQLGMWAFHLVSRPEHVQHVLQDHHANYPRSWFYDRTRVVIGDGLVSSEGPAWRRQRRMLAPAFAPGRIAGMAGPMRAAAEAMCRRWEAPAADGRPLDIAEEMIRLTLDVVGRTLLGAELGGAADAIGPAVTALLEVLEHRLAALLPLPPSWPTPRNRRFRAALNVLDSYIDQLIADRRARGGPADLLAMLLEARDDETGRGLTDREVRDQVITFIGAGHETTAVALSWTWALLAQHPEAEARARAELADVLGGRAPEVADLRHLRFTRTVLEESLRLYPPVYAVARDARADDVIGGYRIPARSMVLLSPYVTHRRPDLWPDPERFDPDRFAPERAAARPRFAYFPFLGGPHACIGQDFAMMEMLLVVATVARSYRLELAPGAVVAPRPMLSLRPCGGLTMLVRRA